MALFFRFVDFCISNKTDFASFCYIRPDSRQKSPNRKNKATLLYFMGYNYYNKVSLLFWLDDFERPKLDFMAFLEIANSDGAKHDPDPPNFSGKFFRPRWWPLGGCIFIFNIWPALMYISYNRSMFPKYAKYLHSSDPIMSSIFIFGCTMHLAVVH